MARHKETQREAIRNETRQKLLEATIQELANQGFDKANVNRIAQQAGFSIGTLYNYFPTKRQLMYAFIEETAQIHVSYIQERVFLEALPERRLQTFFEAGFTFIEENITQAKAIFNTLNGPDEDFKLRLFQAYQPLFQLISEDVIKSGINQGTFRQINSREIANLIMLIYLGVGSQFNQAGKLWVTASMVSSFVLNSLQNGGKD